MHIPIKDASLEYSQAVKQVGFLNNVKLPQLGKIQGAAAKTCIAFSILGAGVFTISSINTSMDVDDEIRLANRTSSGKVTQVAQDIVVSKEVAQAAIDEKQQNITIALNTTGKNQSRLASIANFSLPKDMKLNNYPKAISEFQLNKGEYYLALVSMAEGFSPVIKPDNRGYFIGFGWNLTLNSMEDNQRIAQTIGMKPEHVRIIKNLSIQSKEAVTPEEIKTVTITPQQGMQAAYLIGEQIRTEKVIPGIKRVLMKHRQQDEESSHSKAIETFNSLNRYEQDLLVYHGYKAGNQFLKFKNLVLKVVDYAENSVNLDRISKVSVKKDIVKELDYSFKLKGKKILDTRAQEITSAMFFGPHHFAEKMGLEIKADKKIAPPRKMAL